MLSDLFRNLNDYTEIKTSEINSNSLCCFEFNESLNHFVWQNIDSQIVEFSKKKKRRSCNKGYPCGSSCISKSYSCKKKLKGQAKNYAEFLKSSKTLRGKKSQKSVSNKQKEKSKKSQKEHLSLGMSDEEANQSSFHQLLGNAAKHLEKEYGMTKQESVRAVYGVNMFTSSNYPTYKKIDKGLKKPSVAQKRHIDGIYNYIEKAPKYDGEIHRGISLKQAGFNQSKFEKQLEKGLDSLSSFSSNMRVADKFSSEGGASSDDLRIVLSVKNKSGVSVKRLSSIPDEDEVIVPKGVKYKIVGKEEREFRDPLFDTKIKKIVYQLEEVE
jgi:hypothetical protein